MRTLTSVVCLVLSASVAFAQTSLGTITGIVADPTGAVIANAVVEAKNVATGVVYRGTSSETGNYTINQLPLGPYEVSLTLQGFKKYNHQNMTIVASQILREDISLQLGSSSESVTVTAESTLLKTESSELAHNVTIRQLDNLPILPVNGGGVSGLSGSFEDGSVPLIKSSCRTFSASECAICRPTGRETQTGSSGSRMRCPRLNTASSRRRRRRASLSV